MLTVGVDGSALGNPGPAGWAWYIDDANWEAGGWDNSTNNRGELSAVLKILEATQHTTHDLNILADSQYVINSITKWMPGWKHKGWKKSDGKPVNNKDLMVQLDELMSAAKPRVVILASNGLKATQATRLMKPLMPALTQQLKHCRPENHLTRAQD